MAILHLPVKGVYFHQMKDGTKDRGYRLKTPHWKKKLENRDYDEVQIKLGYPKKEDSDRILICPWLGYEEMTITHEHFGPEPVEVYAIRIEHEC